MSGDLLPLAFADPPDPLGSSQPPPTIVATPPRRELVVLDGGLPDIDALVAALAQDPGRRFEVVVLDRHSDGIAQITGLLDQRVDLDALHIVSHGQAGALRLGNVTLETEALELRAAALTGWYGAFRTGADVLLYGCDLAGNLDGVRFMDTLGALTGMDVAASDDATGSADLGGDWDLEILRGTVDTDIAFDADLRRSYGGVFALLAEETFPNSGNLDGDTTGVGWADAWSVDSNRLKANGGDLSDAAGLLAGAGSSAIGLLTGPMTTVTATRNLGTAIGVDGTTTWIGFLVSPDSTSPLDYMGLVFGDAAGDVAYAGYSGTSFILQESGSLTWETVPGATAASGQSAFIALKIESAAGNDTITMYVDPTPGLATPDSAQIAVTTDIDLGSFTRIGIATGRGLSANQARLDEIRVGNSFLDIAPSLQVTTTADSNASGIVQGNAAHTVAWLNANRGGSVSLREAIIAANNTAGTDTVQFNLPGAGPHAIALTSALPAITDGIVIDGTSQPGYAGAPIITIRGTGISAAADGLDLRAAGNTVRGVSISHFDGAGIRVAAGSTDNTITGNVITANTGAGVALAGPDAAAAVQGNLIHANGGQGIDLGADGAVLLNDAGDTDAGPNAQLNFPVIHSATVAGGLLTITGEARAGVVVEFFEADTDATAHGEAVVRIGSGTVGATGTAGTVDATAIQFSFTFAQGTVALADRITATATESAARTSEFAANVTVAEPNVAPVLDSTRSPALTAVLEDAGAPSGAVGTLVSQLVDLATPAGQLDNVTDGNVSPQLGIAVTAADATSGTWWFSTDDGAHWTALGIPAAGASRLLAADAGTRLHYQPDADTHGTIASAITFRAWDRTTGTNGGTADTSTHGGSTAFSTATDTASLVVTAVNDAPTLSAIADQAIAEDGTTGALALTVADIDSTVAGLVVTATSSDTTRIPVANLVVGGSGANRTITVTPAADANGGPVTITVTVSDGAATTSTDFDVTISAVNDAPVNTAPATVSGHQDTVIVFSAATNRVAISDVDGGAAMQVTLTADLGGVVTLSGVGGLVFVTGDGTADATLTFSGSVADINAALEGMRLRPGAAFAGTASLTIVTDDQGATGSGGAHSDTDIITVEVVANAAPAVTVAGAPGTFTENGADVVIDGALTVADADSTHFTSAVVAIAGNYRSDQDRLMFADSLGITGTWNTTLGTLTLAGTATRADYETALRTVQYRNVSEAPIDTARTISFSVNDGFGNSVPVTTTVDVVAVNDAPAVTVPTGQSTLEDVAVVFSSALGNAITLADADAGLDGAQVTLSAASGTFTLSRTTGLAFGSGADGTGAMAIAGTVADINAALDGLVFRPGVHATGTVTLRFDALDFGNYGLGGAMTDTETVIVTVAAVNDAPTGADVTLPMAEDGTRVLTLADFTLTDSADTPANALAGIVVTTVPVVGTLTLAGTAVSAGQFVGAASITAGDLRFSPAANGHGAPYASFGFRVRDDGGTADGGIDTAVAANTFTFDVSPVNDAPTAVGIDTAEVLTEDVPLDLVDIVVVDADGDPVTVTLTLSDVAAGTLTPGTSGAVTSTFAAGVWRASGAVAAVNDLLASITFLPAAHYAGAFSIEVSVSDGIAAPLTAIKAVTVTALNDVPVVVANAGATVAEGAFVVISSAQLAATDSDGSAAQLAYTVHTLPAHGVLRVGATVLGTGGSFTQDDIDHGRLSYAHDGSETASDAFRVGLQDAFGAGRADIAFAITVLPVDDPIVLSGVAFTVPASGMVSLTSAMVAVTDADGPAGPVTFAVRNAIGGYLEHASAPGIPITGFTAAELAVGAIRFVVTPGGGAPTFEVSATDGATTTPFVTAVVTMSSLDVLFAAAGGALSAPTVPPVLSGAATNTVTAPAALEDVADAGEAEDAASEAAPAPMAVPRTPPAPAGRESRLAGEGGASAVQGNGQGNGTPGATAGTAVGAVQAILPSVPGLAGQVLPPMASVPTTPGAGAVPALPLTLDAAALVAHQAALNDTAWRAELEHAKEQAVAPEPFQSIVIGSGTALAGSISVGYVMWLVRGGVLLSSLMSSLPAWRALDPLPILGRARTDEDSDGPDEEGPDDPLERLFMRARSVLGRGGAAGAADAEGRK